MKICFYDGTYMFCSEIEIGMDGKHIVVDGYRTINADEIIRIVDE